MCGIDHRFVSLGGGTMNGDITLNRSNAWVALATAALLVVLVAEWARAAGDPTIQRVVDQVSETHYRTYHLDVENMGLGLYGGAAYDMGYRNRDGWTGPGSLGNQEARLYLQDTFAAMGLNVSLQGRYSNVVGELSGTTTPENIYIIGGHYDTKRDDQPGGDDNASGTAGVLEAARVLSQYQFESTIRFIGFNVEEYGAVGSRDYVDNHVIPAGENIVGMVNLDMILRPGRDDDPQAVIDADLEIFQVFDEDVDVDGNKVPRDAGTVTWAQAYQRATADYVPSLKVDASINNTPPNSDHAPFFMYRAFMVTENILTDSENLYYHTREDASDRLANDPNSPSGVTYDFAFATDVTRGTVGLIAQEAVLVTEPSLPLRAGDATKDYEFDQLDLVQVQIAAKYLTGEAATWGEGDWNGAPAGTPSNPPKGDGFFDQVDIVNALQAGVYLTGPYAALAEIGTLRDGQTSLVYDATSGELSVDPPVGINLTSINIDLASGSFIGSATRHLNGAFENFEPTNIFTATFGSGFGSISFGNALPTGILYDDLLADLSVLGSLADGGLLGEVDLVWIPEPSAIVSMLFGLLAALGCRRATYNTVRTEI